ncbi:MAG: glycine cleavage system protein R [Candidatus Porifericomitaceae bacterium WSBS_2022_MAG_OTU9]
MPNESPGKNTYLSLSAVGEMDTDRMEKLYAAIVQSGCNVEASRTLDMGELCGILLQLSGKWGNIARCEDILGRFGSEHGLNVQISRTKLQTTKGYTMSYAIDLIAPDSQGIMHNVMKFINQQGVIIRDIHTNSLQVRDSDTAIFTLHATVRVPDSMPIGSFRADFGDLCDHLNLDAVIEPIKPYE